ncbi:conserved hypothetical protein [Hahella chejuensis KCTC 2396]|uniref:Glycosyl transferase family 28 C-terminal domain-containing protein n=1 Tax=Hahella chejuensis (strain KCTC 2396) TaxID=349521 RepID=Q2SLQ3_HAHCH|nr:hypothetical protein [Hahella chejuensis]ABC28421.1 conserved hypothetical protein [Hahella chejuensis KCTC 2396]
MKTVYCAISFHGFGHLAQAAPVLNRLMSARPDIELVIQSEAPLSILQTWLQCPFRHVIRQTDLGMPMFNALKVNVQATYEAYLNEYERRADILAAEAAHLSGRQPDLVLTNISYRLSAAAGRLQIPSLHFCSLNWADIFLSYCGDKPNSREIYDWLCESYNQAQAFLRVNPGMLMTGMAHVKSIGPISRSGRRCDLREALQRPDADRFVLVSMGGMPYAIPFHDWPVTPGLVWLTGEPVNGRDDFICYKDFPIPHIDLLASCDAVVTKPGYGTLAEAAVNQTPVLYLPRRDWPEEPSQIEWLQQHVPCQEIDERRLFSGAIVDELNQICAAPPMKPPALTGIDEAVTEILALLA